MKETNARIRKEKKEAKAKKRKAKLERRRIKEEKRIQELKDNDMYEDY